jgi:hypothetical protein
LGEKYTDPNPTDRSKSGTKRSIVVDGKGVPRGITVDVISKDAKDRKHGMTQSFWIH